MADCFVCFFVSGFLCLILGLNVTKRHKRCIVGLHPLCHVNVYWRLADRWIPREIYCENNNHVQGAGASNQASIPAHFTK